MKPITDRLRNGVLDERSHQCAKVCHLESKSDKMKKLNYLLIQEKENTKLINRENTMLREAEYYNRSHKLSTSAGASPPHPHGGRRGPWWPQRIGLIPPALGQWGL